ncbi:MAG: hypothetical protein KUG77_11855 [Nannocystaceae bacterium]|nr:hypothetical protein [Nannocystaceae bacterium]
MAKLNQILAIEKGKKTQLHKEITELHRATQKNQLMTGHHKTFAPKEEGGETFPDDRQHVQHRASEVIEQVSERLSTLMDVTATKDWANCTARADVVVDGDVFLSDVPVTYLLFLEKELTDLHTFVSKVVELDPAEQWNVDPNSGLFRSDPVTTHRTKKVQRAVVLYDATEHHPAQTQMITDDVVIGHWTTVKFSGALPRPVKKRMLDRIAMLQDAVKFARVHANSMDAKDQRVGAKVLRYVFGDAP